MINKYKLIGVVLFLSALLDVVIAGVFLPGELRIYLYVAGGVTAAVGIAVFMKGLTRGG